MEIVNHPQGHVNALKIGRGWKVRKGQFRPDIKTILSFWLDLIFVKIYHGTRRRILSLVAQRTDNFPNIFSDGWYVCAPSGAELEFE